MDKYTSISPSTRFISKMKGKGVSPTTCRPIKMHLCVFIVAINLLEEEMHVHLSMYIVIYLYFKCVYILLHLYWHNNEY